MSLSPSEFYRLRFRGLGLSQRELARRLGVSSSTAHEYLNGYRRLSGEMLAMFQEVERQVLAERPDVQDIFRPNAQVAGELGRRR